jgi:peroxiredoxin
MKKSMTSRDAMIGPRAKKRSSQKAGGLHFIKRIMSGVVMANPSVSTRTPLPVGTAAPPFTLNSTPDQRTTLSDFSGSPLVLVFYPLDFSPVCSDELGVFNELLPELRRYRAQLVGISVDSPWCHLAYARERRLRFPLLADFHPKGEVATRYQVYRDEDGFSERALYVLDGDLKVFWSYVAPVGVNPGADGVLDALDRLVGATSSHPDSSAQTEAMS